MEALFHDPSGPIEAFSWGRYVICGEIHEKTDGSNQGKGKDLYIIDNQKKKWNERKGRILAPQMVSRVIDKDVDVLIIDLGVYGEIDFPFPLTQSAEAVAWVGRHSEPAAYCKL